MILHLHEGKGWLGLLGSLDVMERLSQCTQRSISRKRMSGGLLFCVLEAAVDCRLWFWHVWFGMHGATNNDLNILDRSPFFHDLSAGRTPKVHFAFNSQQQNLGYYLVDGIYSRNRHKFCQKNFRATRSKAELFLDASSGDPAQGRRASIWSSTGQVEDPCTSTLVSGCYDQRNCCMHHFAQHDQRG